MEESPNANAGGGADPPPALPPGSDDADGPGASADPARIHWLAWVVILLLSAVTLAATIFFAQEKHTNTDEPGGWAGGPSPLEMELQSKLLIGMSGSGSGSGSGALGASLSLQSSAQMQSAATSPGSARVAAATLVYVDPEQNRERAIALWEKFDHRGADGPHAERIGVLDAVVRGQPLTGAQRAVAADGMEWWGRLALAADSPAGSAERQAVAAAGQRFVMLYFGGMLGAATLGFTGAALALAALIQRVRGRLPLNFARLGVPFPGRYAEGFAAYLAAMILAPIAIEWGTDAGWIQISADGRARVFLSAGVAAAAACLGFLWMQLTRRHRLGEVARAIGLHRGRGVWREVIAGVAGYLTLLPGLFVAVMLVGAILLASKHFGWGIAPPSHPIQEWAQGADAIDFLGIFFLAAVVAPVIEEIGFRGFFYRALRGKFGVWASALTTGLVFAAVHPQGLLGIPAILVLGAGFCLLREWRDSLIAPMVAHAVNNGMVTLALYLMTR